MIVRLSEMPEDVRESYVSKYNEMIFDTGIAGFKMLEPTEDFDEYGLRFPIDYLNTIGVNVVFLPLEIMANYVDIITKTEVDRNNQDFINNIIYIDLTGFNVEQHFNTINATAIGNMAYMALNCKNEQVQQICLKQLNAIFEKAKENIMKLIQSNTNQA